MESAERSDAPSNTGDQPPSDESSMSGAGGESDLASEPSPSLTEANMDVSATPASLSRSSLQIAEQTFHGSPHVSETQMVEMMLSGQLSLNELKELERKLKTNAKEMQKRNRQIRNQIQKQSGH